MSVRSLNMLERPTLTFHEKGFWITRGVPLTWDRQAALACPGTSFPHGIVHGGRVEIKRCAIAHDGTTDS